MVETRHPPILPSVQPDVLRCNRPCLPIPPLCLPKLLIPTRLFLKNSRVELLACAVLITDCDCARCDDTSGYLG